MIKKIFNKLAYVYGNYKYDKYFKKTQLDRNEINKLKNEVKSFKNSPKISIIVPTYNTPESFFNEMLESVKTQIYENWELIIVDDCSPNEDIRENIKKAAKKDSRIKYKFLPENKHISGATNEAFKMASGDFVALFDHDDLLLPNTLFEVVKAVNKDKNIDFIYTDEDKFISETGKHKDAFLKPDWNENLLFSVNYITHFTVIKKNLLDKTGGERSKYDGAQDWDLILRVTSIAKKVHHIPKVLYSWRVHKDSTAGGLGAKPYVIEAQRNAIKDNLIMRGFDKDKIKVSQDKKYSGQWKNNTWEGETTSEYDIDNVKGLAMTKKQIHKYLGINSLTEHIFKTCSYEVLKESKKVLFIPKNQ